MAVKPEKGRHRLSKKQKEFADAYLTTGEKAKSALHAYDTDSFAIAASIASENLNKPNIQAYLADKSADAASMVYYLSQHSRQDFIKLNASKDILDRAGYKAVDRSVSLSVNVQADAKAMALIAEFESKLNTDADDEARAVKP